MNATIAFFVGLFIGTLAGLFIVTLIHMPKKGTPDVQRKDNDKKRFRNIHLFPTFRGSEDY